MKLMASVDNQKYDLHTTISDLAIKLKRDEKEVKVLDQKCKRKANELGYLQKEVEKLEAESELLKKSGPTQEEIDLK